MSGERGEVEAVTGTDSPRTSATATTRTPARASSRAAPRPTLPKPCTAAVASRGSMPARSSANRATDATPSDVAAARPCEPPSESGLPVTVPHPALVAGAASIIQAISAAPEPTSGAGISRSAPVMGATARA